MKTILEEHNFLIQHEDLQKQLNLDNEHVIIDKKDYEEISEFLNQNKYLSHYILANHIKHIVKSLLGQKVKITYIGFYNKYEFDIGRLELDGEWIYLYDDDKKDMNYNCSFQITDIRDLQSIINIEPILN